jgi:regulation of enolase protein 1 (concanavalin A-like superfamily)
MKRICLLALALPLILGAGLGSPLCAQAGGATAVGAIREDFTSRGSLASWTIEREDPGAWRIDEGALVVRSESGDLWGALNDARNVFVRPLPFTGDLDISLDLAFGPKENWEQAGLMLYQDDDNYIVLKALFDNREKLQFGKETKGYFSSLSAEASLARPFSLRLVRKGKKVSGFFKGEGGDWVPTGTYDAFINNAKAGILVCNGGSSKAAGREARVTRFTASGETTAASYDSTKRLEYTKAPADNPLKGFMPYRDGSEDGFTSAQGGTASKESFPHSLEWFYLPLSSTVVAHEKYDWASLDRCLDDVASRGCQSVFRFYLDYPDKPSGIPPFLLAQGLGLKKYDDYGGGLCPDYRNPALIGELLSFIKAFGARYDGDLRIGFITLGLIGFWGEWHTYPHEEWMPDTATVNRILRAYASSFNRTKLLLRYPMGDSPSLELGYHDDSFAYQTLDTSDSNFLALLGAAGLKDKWRKSPVGGEIRPEVQRDLFKFDPPRGAEDLDSCIDSSHASWMLDQSLFAFPPRDYSWITAITAARRLGYELSVTEVSYTSILRKGAGLGLKVGIKNGGVAPFYYDWKLLVGLLAANGSIAKVWESDWKISRIMPGEDATVFLASFADPGIPAGEYRLCLKAANPLKGGKSLYFANVEQAGDGWLELAKVSVE